MSALVHLVKQDSAARNLNVTTPTEVTEYTIDWADLTGAGFAAGDDVLILVASKLASNSSTAYARFRVGRGTTYAGRTDFADSYQSVESPAASTAMTMQYGWFHRHTLVTDQNLYFSLWHSGATLVGSRDFFCLVLKLGGLTSSDFAYASATHSGDAPTTYGTTGASFSTPAAGDWLLFAFAEWLVDSVSADMLLAISAGGVDYSEVNTEGEDLENEVAHVTMAYRAALGSGQTVQARFRASATSHDCIATKVFGLRLDAFRNHWGAHTADTLTHSVIDTYQEFAGNGSFAVSVDGPVLALGFPLHLFSEVVKQPYGRIQIADADWDGAGRNRSPARDNGADAKQGPILNAYATLTAAGGPYDVDMDVAEDADVSPTYDCVEQVAAMFTLELASTATYVDLAGIIASVFSLAGASAVARNIAGALGSSAALTGQIAVNRAIAGTLPMASGLSAAMARTAGLSGTVPLMTTLDGLLDIFSPVDLAGLLALESSLSGSAGVTRPLAGTLALASQLDGALGVLRPFAGVIPVASVLSGLLAADRPLAGTLPILAVLSADARMDRTFAGIVPIVVALDGAAAIDRGLAGFLAVAFDLVGALDVSGLNEVLLAGEIPLTTALSGVLARNRQIAGVIPMTAALTGAMGRIRDLQGLVQAASVLAGQIAVDRGLGGQVPIVLITTGELAADRPLSGTIPLGTVLVGDLEVSVRVLLIAPFEVRAATRSMAARRANPEVSRQAHRGSVRRRVPVGD